MPVRRYRKDPRRLDESRADEEVLRLFNGGRFITVDAATEREAIAYVQSRYQARREAVASLARQGAGGIAARPRFDPRAGRPRAWHQEEQRQSSRKRTVRRAHDRVLHGSPRRLSCPRCQNGSGSRPARGGRFDYKETTHKGVAPDEALACARVSRVTPSIDRCRTSGRMHGLGRISCPARPSSNEVVGGVVTRRWLSAPRGALASVAGPLVVLCWGVAPQPAPAVSGPLDFSVFAYDLELRIDRDRRLVTGRETIHLRGSADGLTVIAFPRNGIQVLSVTSKSGDALPTLAANDQIEIRPPVALARGQEFSIVVKYSATEPKGVEFHPDAVYTSFHTCHWMVCRDRPDDKATLTLAITVPDGLTMVASGAPVAGPPRHERASDRQVWQESVPSSPYLFGFAIGKFSRMARTHRGVTLEYFAVGGDDAWLRRVFADDDRMLDFFVEKAGRPLPRPFYRQIVVDGGAAQEMSSFSILGQNHLDLRLVDPTEDWLVAHEMAHQFWGNLVTCADWSHFWLNEGLTVFMVAAYKEQRWGRPAYERELGLLRARHQAAVDATFDVPLTFAGEYPSLRMKRAIVYSKGALFVARLRETMGERAFWTALARYTRRFAGRAVVTQDFQRVFAAETDEDLSKLFDDWAYGRDPAAPGR